MCCSYVVPYHDLMQKLAATLASFRDCTLRSPQGRATCILVRQQLPVSFLRQMLRLVLHHRKYALLAVRTFCWKVADLMRVVGVKKGFMIT
jgi:hypothetical protein